MLNPRTLKNKVFFKIQGHGYKDSIINRMSNSGVSYMRQHGLNSFFYHLH
jgi:hypothetical protein